MNDYSSGVLLDCSFSRLNAEDFRLLNKIPNLNAIDLSNTPTDNSEIKQLEIMGNLKLLNLSNTNVTQLEMVNFPVLDKLYLNNMRNPLNLNYLTEQLKRYSLSSLELESNKINSISLQGIRSRYISLYSNPLRGNVELSEMHITEELNLIGTQRENWKLTNLPRLKKIYLSYSFDLSSVVLSELPELERIDAAYNPNLSSLIIKGLQKQLTLYRHNSPALQGILKDNHYIIFNSNQPVPMIL